MTRKTLFLRVVWLAGLLLMVWPLYAQEPAPTLVPPTLVPQPDIATFDALPSESGIAQMIRSGQVRVGILFNESPFGVLDVRGQVAGFDADMARAMAEAWGVEAVFVQVTRQTALDALITGQVELLLAALPHTRDLDTQVEFSQTYYPTAQVMMVRDGDSAQALAEMGGRRVGLVIGTRAETALAYWQSRSGVSVSAQSYLTLDLALAALVNNEVDGVIANRIRLTRAITQPGVLRILPQAVMPEPLAVAVRRQDVNLRNLINRTLQYLEASGRLNEIHRVNFNGVAYPGATFTRWANIGEEAPRPDQFGQDIPFPAQYVIPQMQASGVLRVAGVRDLPPDAPESDRRLNDANRALVETLVSRWGVTAQYVGGDDALGLVAAGAADVALGVTADWNAASQVDFTGLYLQRGELLMVPAASQINGFADLRGRTVCVFQAEPGAAERVQEIGESVRAIIRNTFLILREQDAAFEMLANENCNAIFGDSLRLLPLLQAQPNDLRILLDEDNNPRWYSRSLLYMAVPRNDIDFRLLVEYTLQELALDNTLTQLTTQVVPPGGLPALDIWPGAPEYLGYRLNFSG